MGQPGNGTASDGTDAAAKAVPKTLFLDLVAVLADVLGDHLDRGRLGQLDLADVPLQVAPDLRLMDDAHVALTPGRDFGPAAAEPALPCSTTTDKA